MELQKPLHCKTLSQRSKSIATPPRNLNPLGILLQDPLAIVLRPPLATQQKYCDHPSQRHKSIARPPRNAILSPPKP